MYYLALEFSTVLYGLSVSVRIFDTEVLGLGFPTVPKWRKQPPASAQLLIVDIC